MGRGLLAAEASTGRGLLASEGSRGIGILTRLSNQVGSPVGHRPAGQSEQSPPESATRSLPNRVARTQANLRLLAATMDEDEDVDGIPAELEEDDVAQCVEQRGDLSDNESQIEYEEQSDDTLPDNVLEEYSSNSGSSNDESDDDDCDDSTPSQQCEWKPRPPHQEAGRYPARNVFAGTAHGFRTGLHPATREEAFRVVFMGLIEEATRFTNLAGRRTAYAKRFSWKSVTVEEMKAFIGLHVMAGALKAHHRRARELFTDMDGHPLFRSTMSYKRFSQLKSVLRFDDPARRDHSDKAAPVRYILELFNLSLERVYTPGPFLTIDEMLIEFHGRVSFRQYIPTKPGKFGLKMFWLVDAETFIPVQCLLYSGANSILQSERERYDSYPEALVMTLSKKYLGQGRNITADNYFTSLPLVERLENERTTYVGTVRKNRRGLPPCAATVQGRSRGDAKHFYRNNVVLCSYWDKGSKPVMLLSTMHGAQVNTQSRDSGKPDIVEFYNSTKAGVDVLDKLVRGYCSKRKCRRWPYSIFFTLVDVAVIMAHKMCIMQNSEEEDHYSYKKALAYELCMPLVLRRAALPKLRITVADAMKHIGIVPQQKSGSGSQGSAHPSASQGRCKLCPREKDRKSRSFCSQCGSFVCAEHQVVKCVACDNSV